MAKKTIQNVPGGVLIRNPNISGIGSVIYQATGTPRGISAGSFETIKQRYAESQMSPYELQQARNRQIAAERKQKALQVVGRVEDKSLKLATEESRLANEARALESKKAELNRLQSSMVASKPYVDKLVREYNNRVDAYNAKAKRFEGQVWSHNVEAKGAQSTARQAGIQTRDLTVDLKPPTVSTVKETFREKFPTVEKKPTRKENYGTLAPLGAVRVEPQTKTKAQITSEMQKAELLSPAPYVKDVGFIGYGNIARAEVKAAERTKYKPQVSPITGLPQVISKKGEGYPYQPSFPLDVRAAGSYTGKSAAEWATIGTTLGTLGGGALGGALGGISGGTAGTVFGLGSYAVGAGIESVYPITGPNLGQAEDYARFAQKEREFWSGLGLQTGGVTIGDYSTEFFGGGAPTRFGKQSAAETGAVIAGLALSAKYPGSRVSSRIQQAVLSPFAKTPGKAGIPKIKFVPDYTIEMPLAKLKTKVGKNVYFGHVTTGKIEPGWLQSWTMRIRGKDPSKVLLRGVTDQSAGWRKAREWFPFYGSAGTEQEALAYLGYAGVGKGYSGSRKAFDLIPKQARFYYSKTPVGFTPIQRGKNLVSSLRNWMKSPGVKVDPSNILGVSVEGQLTAPTAYAPNWAPEGLPGTILKPSYKGFTFYREPLPPPKILGWSKTLSNIWEKTPIISSRYVPVRLYASELIPVASKTATASVKAGKPAVLDLEKYYSSLSYSRGRSLGEAFGQAGSALSRNISKSFVPSGSKSLQKSVSSIPTYESLVKSGYSMVSSRRASSLSKSVSKVPSYLSPSKSLVSSVLSPSKSLVSSTVSSPSKSLYRSYASYSYKSPSKSTVSYKSKISSPSYSKTSYTSYGEKRPPPPPPGYGSRLYKKPVSKKETMGYKVLVRGRGKKLAYGWAKGGWKPLTSKVYSKQGALAVGGTHAQKTIKRSFKIVPAKGIIAPVTGKSFAKQQFYRGKEPGTYIEKVKFAIDTPGEKAALKNAPKTKRTKTKRRRR